MGRTFPKHQPLERKNSFWSYPRSSLLKLPTHMSYIISEGFKPIYVVQNTPYSRYIRMFKQCNRCIDMNMMNMCYLLGSIFWVFSYWHASFIPFSGWVGKLPWIIPKVIYILGWNYWNGFNDHWSLLPQAKSLNCPSNALSWPHLQKFNHRHHRRSLIQVCFMPCCHWFVISKWQFARRSRGKGWRGELARSVYIKVPFGVT